MDEVLEAAIARALTLRRADCMAHGRSFSWAASADQFLAALVPLGPATHRLPPRAGGGARRVNSSKAA
jgi:ribosomal protein L22